jgi:hypothetical protein
MAVGSQDVYLDVGNLVPVAGPDLNANDVDAQYRAGGMSFVTDAFGFRIFQYCRIWNGSDVAQGELMAKVADVDATVASGSTTQATIDSVATANKHEGQLLVVDDNADVAGGEPEGEMGIITAGNTATVINIDADRPFTVALAVSDTVSIHHTWLGDDAADGDAAIDLLGVVVRNGGLTDQYYGWLQVYGVCPDVLHLTNDCADRASLVAAAAAVDDSASDLGHLVMGYQIGTYTASSHDTLRAPAFIQLFGAIHASQSDFTII